MREGVAGPGRGICELYNKRANLIMEGFLENNFETCALAVDCSKGCYYDFQFHLGWEHLINIWIKISNFNNINFSFPPNSKEITSRFVKDWKRLCLFCFYMCAVHMCMCICVLMCSLWTLMCVHVWHPKIDAGCPRKKSLFMLLKQYALLNLDLPSSRYSY